MTMMMMPLRTCLEKCCDASVESVVFAKRQLIFDGFDLAANCRHVAVQRFNTVSANISSSMQKSFYYVSKL